MNVFLLVLPALVAALLTYGLTPVARLVALRIGAVDQPGPRKVHHGEIPRLGGLAVVASVTLVTFVLWKADVPRIQSLADDLALGILLGIIPIFLISLRDDIVTLPAMPKFVAQFIGAGIAVACGIHLGPTVHAFGYEIYIDGFAYVISVLWIVGLTNAFNLIDGLDGLSAGLALISAVSLAGVSLLTGRYGLATVALILAGSLLGFIPYNLHPAKIFLGDTGSTAIGFILACLALRSGSTLSSGMAVIIPVVVLGIPIADTLVAMVRRFLRRTVEGKVGGMFEGDRSHIHHRLLALGLDHRRAVLLLYGIGLVLAAAAFGSIFLHTRGAAVLLIAMAIAAVVGIARLGYDEFAILSRGGMLRVYDVPVLHRALFVTFVDLAFVVASIYAAFVLKYDDWGLTLQRGHAIHTFALLPAIAMIVFFAFGLYRRTWRLASVEDLVRSSGAVVVVTVASALAANLVFQHAPPVTWFLTFMLVLLGFVNGSRSSYRLFRHWFEQSAATGDNVVIYGAGMAGTMAIREALANQELHIRPIGFIDDEHDMKGKFVNGYPVIGGIRDLEALVAEGKVQGLVIASNKIKLERIQEATRICERGGVWLRHFRIGLEDEAAPGANHAPGEHDTAVHRAVT